MSSDIESLIKRIKTARTRRDVLKGELVGIIKQLSEQFDCDSLEEAANEIDRLEEELEEAEREADQRLTRFKGKWNAKLQRLT